MLTLSTYLPTSCVRRKNLPSQKRALEYCEGLKQQDDCWQLCLQKFGHSQYAEVHFWCLQTLQQAMRQQYTSLDASHRQLVSA